jgi:hypothetical protein
MAKIDLSKVTTEQLWAELTKRKAKENFTWYYIDLGEAYDRINPSDEPRRFKTLKGEDQLRKRILLDAENDLQDLFWDAEVGFWDSDVGYYYDDFFVDENK